MKTLKTVLTKLLPWVIVGVIVYFFAKTLSENWHRIDPASLHFNAWALAGVVSFVLAVVISGLLWGRLLSTLEGTKVSTRDAVRIHAASWLLKYVPGQVGSLINKLTWAKKQGISQKAATTSFIYENVLTVIASVLLSLPLIGLFSKTSADASLFLPLFLAVPILLVLYRPIFYGLLNWLFKKLGRKPFRESDFLTTSSLVSFLVLYLLPRLFTGIGFVLVAASLLPVEPYMYIGLASIYILASVVGLLAIFVPGGLGVREAVIVIVASLYFPVEQAILLSLVARLYATVADIGVAVVYLALNKGRIRQ